MKMNINNLLLLLCSTNKTSKYTVTMIKGHNSEKDFIYTKYILHVDTVEVYFTYSSQLFMVYLSDLIDDWLKDKS